MRLNFTRSMCLVILLLPLSLKGQIQVGYTDILRVVDYTTDGTNQYVLTEYNIQVFSKTGSLVRKIALPGTHQLPPRPVGIAVKDGKLYVADGLAKVHVFTTDGVFVRSWNIPPSPDPNGYLDPHDLEIVGNNIYTTDRAYVRTYSLDGELIGTFGSPIVNGGGFRTLSKLTVDENGDIYVTDLYVTRVEKFNINGVLLATFATEGSGVGQLATRAVGLASDGAGNIFVSEPGSKLIHQFTTSGVFVKKFSSGSGVDLEYVAPNIASVENPDRIVIYNKSGGLISTLGGHASDAGKLNYPTGVACDAQGNIYVADRGNFRVQIFNNKGQYLRQFGSYGLANNQFHDLKSIAVASDGKIHLIDGEIMKTFNNDGTFFKVWGTTYGSGPGQFAFPKALTVDKDDNIWIADTQNQRVQVLDKNYQFVKHIGVNQYVQSVAVDAAGNMYVTDGYAGVRIFPATGGNRVIASSGPNLVTYPNGVAVRGSRVYILSREGVSIFDESGTFIDINKNFGAEPNQFVPDQGSGYTSITISPAGQMIVSDLLRVQIISSFNTINFASIGSKTYGDPAFNLIATSDSGLPVIFESSDPTIASINGIQVTILKAGTVTITANQPGNGNDIPAATPVSQQIIIKKADQGITFPLVPQKRWGDPDFILEATSSRGVPVEYGSSNPNILSISSNLVQIKSVGGAYITAVAPETEKYNSASVDQYVVVNKGLQTITFDPIPPKILADKEVILPELTSAGNKIQYESSNSQIVSISGNVASLKSVGVVTIYARQPGNELWEAAPTVTQQLTVNAKRPQELEFPEIENKHYGDGPFELVASATSELPITFQSEDESIISIEGNIATIHKPGSTYIVAWQGGNDEYEPTVAIFQPVTVEKGIPSIDFKPIPEMIFIKDETFTLQATSSINVPIKFLVDHSEVATVQSNVLKLVGPGTTTVRAISQETDLYSASEALQTLVVKLITGIEEVEPAGMIYPIPTREFVYVAGSSQPVIFNSIGQTFNAPVESVNKDLQKLNVSHLERGIYFIKINNKAYKLVKE